jgi:hypothetical protein
MVLTPEQRKSRQQEDKTATQYRGSRNAMSGAGWVRKADVRSEHFLIECKTKMDPNAKSYSIKAKEMHDLTKRARLEGRLPLFKVDMGGRSYVVLNEDDFLDMIGEEDE